MPTTAINSIGNTPPSALTPTTQGLNSLNPTDFYKLLIAELQSQDPLKPTDSNQLVQEMSTIQQMSTANTLNSTLNTFASQQRVGEASNLIGRYVTGTVHSADGSQTAKVQGLVTGVQFGANGDAVLQLHTGDLLPIGGVTSVTFVDTTTPPPPPNPDGSGIRAGAQPSPAVEIPPQNPSSARFGKGLTPAVVSRTLAVA